MLPISSTCPPALLIYLQEVVAKTESELWLKFGSLSAKGYPHLAMFNLEAELALEGLDGALQCSGYKFHVERGYGDRYVSEEEAALVKSSFISKSGRQRRSTQRREVLTSTEIKRAQEEHKRQEEELKALKRKRTQDGKARKEREREQLKQRKEEEREAIKAGKVRSFRFVSFRFFRSFASFRATVNVLSIAYN